MNWKRGLLVTCFMVAVLLWPKTGQAADAFYTVVAGESYETIAKAFHMDAGVLQAYNHSTDALLKPSQQIALPAVLHKAQEGESYFSIAQEYDIDFLLLLKINNPRNLLLLATGDTVIVPKDTCPHYIVKAGESYESIAIQQGYRLDDVLQLNRAEEESVLQEKWTIRVPSIPVEAAKTGEYLSWQDASKLLPTGTSFQVVDFETGKAFNAKRTTGTNHADCEPLSMQDTCMMKEIWGGALSWVRRPVLIRYEGRTIAASATSMGHAGNENAPGGSYTSWRSDGYGPGYNYDTIKGNGMDGHFDIHFAGSTRHMDGKQDPDHQACILISAGK